MSDPFPALTETVESAPKMEAFTFGDPVPVMDSRELLDYIECCMNGRWYEPPISFDGLAKSFRASTHHSSAIYFKRNILLSTYVPHPLLSREAFSAFALDYLIFGNAYLERRKNRLGGTLGLKHALSKYMRRGADLDTYFYVRGWRQEDEFEAGSVYHMREADINQEVYGLPEYLITLQADWLIESVTLFRRED